MENIIIYGMGMNGKHALNRIRRYYADEISVIGFMDTYNKENTLNMDDISTDSTIVISMASRKQACKIYDLLVSKGFANIYIYKKKDSPRYKKDSSFFDNECVSVSNTNKDLIPHIEIHASDKCNLNCKGCAHFSPLFKDEIDDNRRLEDIKKIAKISTNVLSFYILGGEPFLSNNLDKYIDLVRASFPRTDLQIVTNGTKILGMNEYLLSTIRNNKAIISISVYKATERNIDRIVYYLEKNGVDYNIRCAELRKKFNKPLALNINSSYEKMCISDGCTNICDGKVSRCPTVMFVHKVNETFDTTFPTEGLYDIESFTCATELNMAMNSRIPLCDYCVKNIIDWECCGESIALEDFVGK